MLPPTIDTVFAPVPVQVAHRRQHILFQRRIHRVLVARPVRLAVAAKIDRQHFKSRCLQQRRLLGPALLVELASVRQHHRLIADPYRSANTTPPSSVGNETVFCAAAKLARGTTPQSARIARILPLYYGKVFWCAVDFEADAGLYSLFFIPCFLVPSP